MGRGRNFPVSISALIRGVKPKNAAKWLEGGLNISPRQSWRIVQTGKAPGKLRAPLIRLLENALESNRAEIERLQRELKALDHEEMVERAASRREAVMGQGDPTLFGRSPRAEEP